MVKCLYCGKEYTTKGIGTHIWRNHGSGKTHDPNVKIKTGEKKVWNKGLSKEDDRVAEIANKTSLTVKLKVQNGTYVPVKWSDSFRERQSLKMSTNNPGGKCKWYLYEKENGEKFNLQGTWELRFAKVLDVMDPDWIKPGVGNKNHSFKWMDENGIEHYYTPDFWSPKLEKYFEVKGYWWGNDKEKMRLVLEQNTVKIEIIQRSDLESYEKLGR